MENNSILEEYFNKYITSLADFLPEGLIQVDIDLLQKLDLLHYHNYKPNPSLTRYFHVIESVEKITLINEQFIVWIVPENLEEQPMTFVLIALNNPEQPHLEMGFVTMGVYNTSRLVLKLLEKFLFDIQENEEALIGFR
jgi:hypothetical protein